MARHYLSYVKPEKAAYEVQRQEAESLVLDHWASDQYKKVQRGDELWLVTIFEGKLFLFGHLVVSQLVSHQEAVAILERDDLWDAEYHVIPEPEDAEGLEIVDIHELADALRFESEQDHLRFEHDGTLTPQQLQTMRRLTPETANLFEVVWYPEEDEEFEAAEGFQPESALRKQVEEAAVNRAISALENEGWCVRSVELERCGFDLHCKRDDEELHVEVKGSSAIGGGFIITAQELSRAKNDRHFELWSIQDCLSEKPHVARYTGGELTARFAFEPIQFRATEKRDSGGFDSPS